MCNSQSHCVVRSSDPIRNYAEYMDEPVPSIPRQDGVVVDATEALGLIDVGEYWRWSERRSLFLGTRPRVGSDSPNDSRSSASAGNPPPTLRRPRREWKGVQSLTTKHPRLSLAGVLFCSATPAVPCPSTKRISVRAPNPPYDVEEIPEMERISVIMQPRDHRDRGIIRVGLDFSDHLIRSPICIPPRRRRVLPCSHLSQGMGAEPLSTSQPAQNIRVLTDLLH